jgi:hypothetical protein
MYCPNCGNKNSDAQNFCRSCGLGLEKIAQSLTEQLPSVAVESLQVRKERLERWGVGLLSVFGVGLVGFLFYNIFSSLMLTHGALVATLSLLGATLVIGCGLGSVILFAKAKELKEASAKRQLTAAEKTVLDSPQRPSLSVTDRTTDLLPASKRSESSDLP